MALANPFTTAHTQMPNGPRPQVPTAQLPKFLRAMGEPRMTEEQAHEDAITRGEPGYFDPVTGLYVMTSAFHLERGSCCNSGCRHCPYT